MSKINLKRLHEVHKYYPNVPRRMGKTMYCFDALLRAAQTGQHKELAYITNTEKVARNQMTNFIDFLSDIEERYMTTSANKVFLISYNTEVNFIGTGNRMLRGKGIDSITDYYE